MNQGRWLWALVLTLALGLLGAGTAHAQTGVKVLVLKGANDATNTAGVTAIKALGQANDFVVDEAAGVTRHQRRQARRLPGARLPQRRRRRARLRR